MVAALLRLTQIALHFLFVLRLLLDEAGHARDNVLRPLGLALVVARPNHLDRAIDVESPALLLRLLRLSRHRHAELRQGGAVAALTRSLRSLWHDHAGLRGRQREELFGRQQSVLLATRHLLL